MYADIKNINISEPTRDKATQIIESCVHCGFCLATCPTYQLLGDELDSPRGRIYLIKSALEQNQFSLKSLSHMDRCLTCRSCETTCPSGVEYGQLLEIGRDLMESKRGKFQALYRFIVRKTLLTPIIFKPLGYFYRHSKITSKLLKPKKINSKVLLIAGCVQPSLAPNINHSIKNILAKLNIEVLESSQGQCCGALDQHLAASSDAMKKVKQNIDALKRHFLGSNNAPIKIKEYVSLTCGHCANFHNKTLPQFKKKYIDTGKVQLEFVDYPLDRLAIIAAALARTIPTEKGYIEAIAILLKKQKQWAYSKKPIVELQSISKLFGISSKNFDTTIQNVPLMQKIVNKMEKIAAFKIINQAV